jgi:hypothetical protein
MHRIQQHTQPARRRKRDRSDLHESEAQTLAENQIRRVLLPGGPSRRADFIIGSDSSVDVILELKGSDLKHALIQVTGTLTRWKDDPIHYPSIVCLIVFGHTYPRMTSRLGVLEREFLDQHRTLLWIRESVEEKFSFRKLSGRS